MRDTIIFLVGIFFVPFAVAAMGLYFAWRERRR